MEDGTTAAALVILHTEHNRTTRSPTATNRYPERLSAIVVVVGIVVVGLLYVVIAFVGSFFSHAAVPW
jgi:hypothetical protein